MAVLRFRCNPNPELAGLVGCKNKFFSIGCPSLHANEENNPVPRLPPP